MSFQQALMVLEARGYKPQQHVARNKWFVEMRGGKCSLYYKEVIDLARMVLEKNQ